MTVRVRPTPNPDSLKFEAEKGSIVPSGLLAFHSASEAATDPLGAALFALHGVASLLIVPQFVTVTKRPDASWDGLIDAVERVLLAHAG